MGARSRCHRFVLVPEARLGVGCVTSGGDCDAPSSASAAIGTPASGMFDVYVAFILSGNDSYSTEGRAELKDVDAPVPEPASSSLLVLGLGWAAARRWRQRQTPA